MVASSLSKRVAVLEAKARCSQSRVPTGHIIHGDTKRERDAKILALIQSGKASAEDIFFSIAVVEARGGKTA